MEPRRICPSCYWQKFIDAVPGGIVGGDAVAPEPAYYGCYVDSEWQVTEQDAQSMDDCRDWIDETDIPSWEEPR